MRIALIRPGLGLGRKQTWSLACMEPGSLALLAGLTPPGIETSACDDRFEEIPYEEPWDLVALSVGSFEALRAYEIADRFRARGVRVVMGGVHPSFCPDEAALHADAVAIGEAEALWPDIVRDAARGALRRRYRQIRPPDLGGVAPRRSIFAGKRYVPVSVVQFGRGCHHACDFCCVSSFYGRAIRRRGVREVAEEIEAAGRRWVVFSDDNLVADREEVRPLLRAIEPLGIRWTAQASLDALDDAPLLDLMAASGCQALVVGIESLNGRNLRQMGKSWSAGRPLADRLAAIRDRGIMIFATFVFGYDDDDAASIARTLDFALEQRFFIANFNNLQPYPGTRLYRRLESERRLVYDAWWLDPRYRFGEAVFHPRGMSAEELTRETARARARFYSLTGIAGRLLDRKANSASLANALAFAATNLACRQDIDRKRGRPLGIEGLAAGRDGRRPGPRLEAPGGMPAVELRRPTRSNA